ncbi:TLC domain-containing protein 5-like, partial [Diorhabda sublineata]|uniref:TLC domain-containing protein 5-like n=1 Tax=Diorhabda sublineata TaxID=1163346 RepID=UPI0024E10063
MLEDELIKNGHINFESPLMVIVNTLLWRFAYIIVVFLLPKKSPEYWSRIITFVHDLVAAFVGINQCFVTDSPFEHPEWRTNYVQSVLLSFSAGYFVHDLIWMIQYDHDKLMMAHHTYSAIALMRMLFKGYSGAQATCSLGSMEITNPVLQMRWFIRAEGMYPSILFTSVETTFVIVFVTVRIILGSFILKTIMMQPKNDWDFIIMSIVIYILSWLFLINIFKYLLVK